MFTWEQITAFFKGIFTGFVALIVMAANQFGWTVDVGGVYSTRAEYAYTFAYSCEKIKPNDILGRRETIRVTMGKNEREGFQFILRPRYGDGMRLTVEVSDAAGADGASIPAAVYKESYIRAGAGKSEGLYPDALLPYRGGAETAERRTNQGFYVEFRTDKATAAGIYSGTVTVKDAESGEEKLQAPFSVEVIDVTFPHAAYSETSVGLCELGYAAFEPFYTLNGVERGTPAGDAMYKQYYDCLLDHKLNADLLPYHILDSRADAYMSDPRVTTFRIPYPDDDELLQAYYAKVQSDPRWARKGYFYPIDEPSAAAHILRYTEITDRLARLCPGYHMITPFYLWKFSEDGMEYDNPAIQDGRSDIICAVSDLYDRVGFPEAVQKRVGDNGDRAWWYVCCGPGGGYCNLFIQQQGTRHRLLLWQQYQKNVTGFLYWSAACWNDNPWENVGPWYGDEAFGDGYLFYPGFPIGLNGPIPTLRLKNLADGVEDYDLLCMAEAKFVRAYSLQKAAQLSAAMTSYTGDPARLESVRVSILRDLAND